MRSNAEIFYALKEKYAEDIKGASTPTLVAALCTPMLLWQADLVERELERRRVGKTS